MGDTGIIMSIAFFMVFSIFIATEGQAMFGQEYQIISDEEFYILGGEFVAVAVACVVTTGIPCAVAIGGVGLYNYIIGTSPKTTGYNPNAYAIIGDSKQANVLVSKENMNYIFASMVYKTTNGSIDLINNETIKSALNISYTADNEKPLPAQKNSVFFLLLTPLTLVLGFMLARLARGVPTT